MKEKNMEYIPHQVDGRTEPSEEEIALNLNRFRLIGMELSPNLREKVVLEYRIDWSLYRSRVENKQGKRISRSGKNAELLMRAYFLPRIQMGKKWHLCGYVWLAEFMGWSEVEVKSALAFLKRKDLIYVAKKQFSVTDPTTGKNHSRPAMWQVAEELIQVTPRALKDAEEGMVTFEYADGGVVHIPLSELGPLDQPIVVNNKTLNLLHEIEEALKESSKFFDRKTIEALLDEMEGLE